MPRLKVLFADDHIPEDDIPDDENEIRESLRKRYPEWAEESTNRLAASYRARRQAVQALSDPYDVTIARTYEDALKLIKRSHFDIAIVDLRWFADTALRRKGKDPRTAGWELADAIEEADRTLLSAPTLQIAYSAGFSDTPSISIDAADRGMLPFFKINNEANAPALRAAVKFLENSLERRTPEEKLLVELDNHRRNTTSWLRDLIKQQKLWFALTLVCVALGTLLGFVGIFGAYFWDISVDKVTSIVGVLTTIVSSLLLAQLRSAQKNVEKTQDKLDAQHRERMEEYKRLEISK
jgi:hypothetical protein